MNKEAAMIVRSKSSSVGNQVLTAACATDAKTSTHNDLINMLHGRVPSKLSVTWLTGVSQVSLEFYSRFGIFAVRNCFSGYETAF